MNNEHIVELINEIIVSPGDSIPDDLRETLMDYLSEATLVCPTDDDDILLLQLGPNTFLPASCDVEDFNRIFEGKTPKEFEFGELSKHLKGQLDGIIINPGSFGFVINSRLAWMIFNRISAGNRPVVNRGYDVKVRMNDMRPIHWKDIIIPENITFYELDDILKTLWSFNGHHLSMFLIRNENVRIMDATVADACMIDDFLDSKTTIINEFFEKYKKITYWYDFGDDWQFDIEIKKAVDYDKDYVTIKRFKGKYDPIEDCRGQYGFSEIIYYSEHPDEYSEYYDELIDYLCEFDMEYVQERLENRDYVRRLHD